MKDTRPLPLQTAATVLQRTSPQHHAIPRQWTPFSASRACPQKAPTALFDVDPQGTAIEWLRRRPAGPQEPMAVPSAGREAVVKLAREDGIEHVVLDLPPHSSAQMAWLLGGMDLILIPTRATATDLVTLKQTVHLVHAAKRPAEVILNAFRPQLLEAREIAPILVGHQLTIIGTLGDRVAYSRGLPAGLGGHEMGDETRAAGSRAARQESLEGADRVLNFLRE